MAFTLTKKVKRSGVTVGLSDSAFQLTNTK